MNDCAGLYVEYSQLVDEYARNVRSRRAIADDAEHVLKRMDKWWCHIPRGFQDDFPYDRIHFEDSWSGTLS